MGLYSQKFHCSLYHGENNSQKTSADIIANHPQEAAKEFMAANFPDATVYTPGRSDGVNVWSFGVTVSGQRLWVYGEQY